MNISFYLYKMHCSKSTRPWVLFLAQYKDQMPKVPVSAYLLFSRSKAPKLKEKHPELSQTEIAVRLGKRWNSIGAEKQEKYKQQYAALRRNYTEEIEQFYQDHPDARPPLRVR